MATDNDLIIQLSSDMFAPAAMAHHEGTCQLDVLKSGPDLYTFEGPLSWQVDITNTGDAFLVTGTVEGDAKTACARCMGDADVPLFGEIEGYFVTSPTEPAEYEEDEDSDASAGMDEAEFDILPDDNKIDLEPLILSALLLDVPLVPLCDDDCKGLCPVCGANLNDEACGCSQAAEDEAAPNPDNPFAALKDLKLD